MRLEVQGLGKRFDSGRWGLRGVDLVLEGAGFTLLTGHNGSGKTLLARHLVGLEKPDEGQVLVDGSPLEKCLADTRKRLGFVFQEPEHQILGLTVGEDVGYTPQRLHWPKQRIAEVSRRALDQTGLAGREGELTAFLSGGEKRRLAIASVLAAEPEMIILDEPFNDLDWAGVKILLSILLELHREGIGLLVVTHDLEKCLAHAERLVVMESGAIRADGSVATLWPRLAELGLRCPGPDSGTLAGMTWLH